MSLLDRGELGMVSGSKANVAEAKPASLHAIILDGVVTVMDTARLGILCKAKTRKYAALKPVGQGRDQRVGLAADD
jgi:hypothetical protein